MSPHRKLKQFEIQKINFATIHMMTVNFSRKYKQTRNQKIQSSLLQMSIHILRFALLTYSSTANLFRLSGYIILLSHYPTFISNIYLSSCWPLFQSCFRSLQGQSISQIKYQPIIGTVVFGNLNTNLLFAFKQKKISAPQKLWPY